MMHLIVWILMPVVILVILAIAGIELVFDLLKRKFKND